MKQILLCCLFAAPCFAPAQNRVGIGTSAPVQRLSVDSTLNIDQGNYDDGSKPSLRFGDINTGEAIGSRRLAGGNNPFGLDLITGFTPRLSIANNGNVGIGITNPSYPFHLKTDAFYIGNFDCTNTGFSYFNFNTSAPKSFYGFTFTRNNFYKGETLIDTLNNYWIDMVNDILFLTASHNERMRIKASGQVGIGTSNPQYALHVADAANNQVIMYAEGNNTTFASSYVNSTTATAFAGNGMQRQGVTRGYVGINPANDLILARVRPSQGLQAALTVVNNTGNIGIGTSAPDQRVTIDSTLNIDQGGYDDGTKPSFRFGNALTGEAIGSRRAAGGINPFGLDFYTGNSKRMVITNGGDVGIGLTNPLYKLELYDTASTGIPVYIHSNAGQSILAIGSDAVNTFSGTGYARNNSIKAVTGINGADNLVLKAGNPAVDNITLTPAGNMGINNATPGFPLNFAAITGEKISLYGNSGNNYGIGIQNLLLQLHTDISTADIAFGYGSSTSFNETMRIKGNGNLSVKGDIITDINGTNNGFASPGLRFGTPTSGEAISSKRTAGGNQNGLDLYTNGAARVSIDNSGLVGINGNTTPGARLQINQTGNYNTSEGSTHALEIWDNLETLYMGADGSNSISYIQAVGNSTFHTLALQARGGNVAIGKNTATEKIDVNGNGAFSGNLTVQSGKGIVRNYNGTQLKTEAFTYQFSGLVALGAGNTTNLSVSFPEAYTAAPVVYVAGLIPSAGSGGYLECVYNISSISATGFTLSIYNPRASGATFNNGSPNFQVNFAAIGAQ